MKKISIFILTNSPRGYIEKLILDLSTSTFIKNTAHVIVSTNTKDAAYKEHLKSLCQSRSVILKIHKTCDAHMHAHTNYANCETDLCMLLHDDDKIFISDFETYIYNVMANPGYGSYSCNDRIVVNEKFKVNKISNNERRTLDIFEISVAYLLNRHAVCYPAIVYNKRLLEIDFLDQRFGKHTDAFLVSELIEQNHLFFGSPAIGYRIHDDQDSAQKSYKKIFLKFFLLKSILFNIGSCNFSSFRKIINRIKYHYVD